MHAGVSTSEPAAVGNFLRRMALISGQSVVALRCREGVVMGADTQLCYAHWCAFKDITRLIPVPDCKTLVGYTGEYADAQQIVSFLEDITTVDYEDGLQPKSGAQVASYLSRVLYNRRSKLDPLAVQIVVAGPKNTGDEKLYLGYVDLLGTHFEDDIVTTGLGNHYALAFLRANFKPEMSLQEAKTLVIEAMRILYARDCMASNNIEIATVSNEGDIIKAEPFDIHAKWHIHAYTKSYAHRKLGVTW